MRRVIAEGEPAREIIRYAHENEVSLIMMPSHGFGPFRRFMIGSTTAKVLHDAHIPVWTDAHVEGLLRELAPQVLGVLVRRYGQFDACEDAVQEALVAASQQWSEDGVPETPRSWLTTAANRRGL